MIAAETMGDVEVESVQGDALILKPRGGNPLTAETIGRYRAAIQAAAGRILGGGVRVALVGEELAGGSREPGPGPSARGQSAVATPLPTDGTAPGSRPPTPTAQRLTASGAQAERAKSLRGRDPALDHAMDTLDLELLE